MPGVAPEPVPEPNPVSAEHEMPDSLARVAPGTSGPEAPTGGLAGMQAAFAAAMAGQGDDAVAATLAGREDEGPRSSTRLDIYRNNIGSALVRALEGLYPALVRLMGADFFARVARDYARAHPPGHGRLLEYGFDFPEFVAGYEAAAGYPWFGDVARLELAWHCSYIAAEAEALRADELAGVPPDRMADLVLVPHPSCQRLASRYPISEIWRIALEDDEPEGPVEVEGGAEWLLVVRPGAEVEVRTFQEAGFTFLGSLAEGRSLGAAYESACAMDPAFDLEAHLAGLLAGETFAGFRLDA